jgi:hypothetical protein
MLCDITPSANAFAPGSWEGNTGFAIGTKYSPRRETIITTTLNLFSSSATQEEEEKTSPCSVPEDNDEKITAVTAQALRSASVLDFEGKRVNLGSAMKEGTSIVVFLRHLG